VLTGAHLLAGTFRLVLDRSETDSIRRPGTVTAEATKKKDLSLLRVLSIIDLAASTNQLRSVITRRRLAGIVLFVTSFFR